MHSSERLLRLLPKVERALARYERELWEAEQEAREVKRLLEEYAFVRYGCFSPSTLRPRDAVLAEAITFFSHFIERIKDLQRTLLALHSLLDFEEEEGGEKRD